MTYNHNHGGYTPDNITSLNSDEVFVFGSNLDGNHSGGAARVARELFGAIMGQGEGMQGQSYAIPTMQGGIDTIKPYVDNFIKLATEKDQTTFFVTRIGCGKAGFKDSEIAPLFAEALKLYNVRLPKSFVEEIAKLEHSYLPDWTKHYTSYDMMIDLLLAANRLYRYRLNDKETAIERIKESLGAYLRGISQTCDYHAFQNPDVAPTHQWVESQLKEAAHRMAYNGLLTVPIQRFSLMLEAEIAHMLIDVTGGISANLPIGWDDMRSFGYIVVSILTGRWNCGDNRYLGEYIEKAFEPIEKLLSEKWDSLCVNDFLDENKVLSLLSSPILWEAWRSTVNHNKAIYNWFDIMLMRMAEEPDGYYCRGVDDTMHEYLVPRHDMTAPVFLRLEGRVHFPNFQLKRAFIKGLNYDSKYLK